MTNTIKNFKTASRVALVALVLGAGGMAAAPAQAQNFSFGFQIPGSGQSGGGLEFNFGTQGAERHGGGYNYRCLTNREIRRGISDYGFRNVEIVRELRGDRVEVRANYRGDRYSMRVDRCTGKVDRIERIRRGGNDHRPDRDNSDRGWPFNQY